MIRWRPLFLCVFTFAQFNIAVPAFSQNKGIVSYELGWGSSQQVYTYTFSGTVTRHGEPCVGAQVQVNLETPNQGVLTESTVTGADGRYLLQVSLQGEVDETASWSLIAQTMGPSHGEPTQVEGRVILMQDETTVAVERLLEIQQG